MRPIQFGMFSIFQTRPKAQKSSPETERGAKPPAYGEHTQDELALSGREMPKAERDFNEWMALQCRAFERQYPHKKGDEEAFGRFLESRHQPAPRASGNPSTLSAYRALQTTGDQLYASDPYAVTRMRRQVYRNTGRQGLQEFREELSERHREARRHNDTWSRDFERPIESMTPLMLTAHRGNAEAFQQLSRHDRNREAIISGRFNQRNLDWGIENRSGHYIPPSELLERFLNEGVNRDLNRRAHSGHGHNPRR